MPRGPLRVPAAHADGDDSPAPGARRPTRTPRPGKAAIRGRTGTLRSTRSRKVAARDPRNADAQNWLGYAYRKSGNLDQAFKHYGEALRLDPRHRGAHEYIGEAYLMKGDLAKAKEHLATLDRLCFFGCEEFSELKKAIAEYEKQRKNEE